MGASLTTPRTGSQAEAYPHAEWVTREKGYFGVPAAKLIEMFELEKEFHNRILATDSVAERQRQYHELYERVHLLTQRDTVETVLDSQYERLVLIFRRELRGKSVLDVGCGNGKFLTSLARQLPHGELCGLDTSSINSLDSERPFKFIQQDITSFTVPHPYEVVFSHQVYEHIAPADLGTHLRSIYEAVTPGGKLIICVPNKYWGPQDVTRIVDNSFRGRVPAMGSHLNEGSYSEMVPQLQNFGFKNIRTLVPLGGYVPVVRDIRVRPWINCLVEKHQWLRNLCNLAARGTQPIFKNPIMLICEKD